MIVLRPSADQTAALRMVAQSAELIDVKVSSIKAKSDVDVRSIRGCRKVDLKHDIRQIEVTEDSRLLVHVGLKAVFFWKIDISGAPRRKRVTNVDVTMVAEYSIPEGPIPDEIQSEGIPVFAEFNAAYNCWPYLRAEIQHITSVFGLIPYTLPPLVVRPSRAESEEEEPRSEDQ